jgi:peptidoglycan/LPS O-acetylase OafA/YrhL
MSTPEASLNYRPEVDGLRALAVISVIINHIRPDLLPAGYLGVDIFFVIPGFVITTSLAARPHNSLGDFLADFYVRRIKRILPALVVVVVVGGIAICLVDPSPRVTLRTGVAALFGLSNIYLRRVSTDYFAASPAFNIFLHTWSLGVEEQFYFLFPVLCWFGGLGRGSARAPKFLLVATALLSAASFVAFVLLYPVWQTFAYFEMPTRFWELSAGCLLAIVSRGINQEGRKLPPILSSLIAPVLVGTLFVPLQFTVIATFCAVALATALIATLQRGSPAYSFFAHRYVVFVGLISYSLYLWHWIVICLSRWTIGMSWWSVVGQIALMFALAILSYRYIETPLRRRTWSNYRIPSIAYGISASASVALLYLVFQGSLNAGVLYGDKFPEQLRQTWWENKLTGQYLEKCHARYFSTQLIGECLSVPAGKNGTVYLIGDSHARNYLPAVRAVFGDDYTVAYLTMGWGCAFLPPDMAEAYSFVGCPAYAPNVARFLSGALRPGDIIVIGQRLLGAPERRTDNYLVFINKLARQFGEFGARVILLDGVAPPSADPSICVVAPWRRSLIDQCFIRRTAVIHAYEDFDRLATEVSARTPNLFYAPLREGLCQHDQCGQITESGEPIWHDKDHITERAATELGPLLRTRLERQGFFRGPLGASRRCLQGRLYGFRLPATMPRR